MPHRLYLGDSQFGTAGKNFNLKVVATLLTESPSNRCIEWEFWDGKQWEVVVPLRDDTRELKKSGEIVFEALPAVKELKKQDISGISSYWLRARLIGAEEGRLPEIKALKKAFELRQENGQAPDMGYLASDKIPIDFSMDFYLFGREPKKNDPFYIGSDIFSRKEAKISISVLLSESYKPLGFEALKELVVNWEYYSEAGNWELLGITSPAKEIKSLHDFADETEAFTHNGNLSFKCPSDIARFANQGAEKFWIRARITQGNYGTEKTSAPILKRFLISFEEERQDFEHYISDNYFAYKDLTSQVKAQKSFTPFEIKPEADPAFYLAFDSPLSQKPHRLYFRIADEYEAGLNKLTWEFYGRDGWRELKLHKDGTHGFSRRGAIEFIPSHDWPKHTLFETAAHWLRARGEAGQYPESPKLIAVYLNAVEVIQAISHRDKILGSSNGLVYQEYNISDGPIRPGPLIRVKEFEDPTDAQVRELKAKMGEDVFEEKDPTGKVAALWIRWHEVVNFCYSEPESRHYTVDLYRATVTFGNGKKGKIPRIGTDNIQAAKYYSGGGAKGNVGQNTITVLEASDAYIESVTNPDPAVGGADAETIEEAKLRGPWALKHRYRAVTVEDFEKLARDASRAVAKAKCIPGDGKIEIVVVPKGESEKLRPGYMLIQKVKKYLDERRLITTRLQIKGPDYVDIVIEAIVVVRPQQLERIPEIRTDMEKKLRIFFHPLTGGSEGHGWPMGRSVHISEIYYFLERMDAVDFVEKVTLNGEAQLKRVAIGDFSFPHLKEAKIELRGEPR